MKSKRQPEGVIHGQVFQYLSLCSEFFGFTVRNGATYDPRFGGYRANKGIGCRNGVSDICGAWNGQALFVEIKTPSGRLTTEQKAFQEDAVEKGCIAITVYSLDDIKAWVEAMRIVAKAHCSHLKMELHHEQH